MTVAAHVYTKLTKSMADKICDFDTDAFKVMLLSAYTVGSTQDTAQFVSDIKAAGTEASGTGYTAGGVAIASPTFTASGHVYTWTSATNPSWSTATLAAAYAVFYCSTPGTDATNPVVCYWDFGGTVSSTASTYQLTLNGSGIMTVTGS